MLFKTPEFWYRRDDEPAPLLEYILRPVSALYQFGHRINQVRKTPVKADMPVVCVGGAVAGGSGKTPVCMALMDLIREEALYKAPHFLTRGYGGTEQGPLLLEDTHDYKQVGDEPLLLAGHGPVIVARDRAAGAGFAKMCGADTLILDDGLQNRSLHKDLTFMVIDGAAGFGNGSMLPAGPLREPLSDAFLKVDAFIMIGSDGRGVEALLPPEKPIFKAHIHPILPEEFDVEHEYIGFAGIGRPEKFKKTLEDLSVKLKSFYKYPDHYQYKQIDIHEIIDITSKNDCKILTTHKDFIKLKSFDHADLIDFISIKLEFEDKNALIQYLQKALSC